MMMMMMIILILTLILTQNAETWLNSQCTWLSRGVQKRLPDLNGSAEWSQSRNCIKVFFDEDHDRHAAWALWLFPDFNQSTLTLPLAPWHYNLYLALHQNIHCHSWEKPPNITHNNHNQSTNNWLSLTTYSQPTRPDPSPPDAPVVEEVVAVLLLETVLVLVVLVKLVLLVLLLVRDVDVWVNVVEEVTFFWPSWASFFSTCYLLSWLILSSKIIHRLAWGCRIARLWISNLPNHDSKPPHVSIRWTFIGRKKTQKYPVS